MFTIKEIAKPNRNLNTKQTIFEFYDGEKQIGLAEYEPSIYKTKLSIAVKHDNDSVFFKLWNLNFQNGGNSNISKTDALNKFKKIYEFLTK